MANCSLASGEKMFDMETDPVADSRPKTKTGRVLTDEDFQALADEAEQGYDVSHLLNRKDTE